jgi:REP element-mobilizing transposase RayT
MTLARQVVPGRTEMTTRRTLRRTFLFRPDPKLIQFYLYCLAVYAERYAIEVHAVVLMSTHEHLIVTDNRRRLPDFFRDFHRVVALGTKILRRWEGTVWDSEPTSRVALCNPKAIIEKLAYIMANPVEAGLVPDHFIEHVNLVLIGNLCFRIKDRRRYEFGSLASPEMCCAHGMLAGCGPE